jgi:hypothetical protein
MYREMTYHANAYKIVVFLGSDPYEEGSWANRLYHVDFEKNQNFKTYARRVIGNFLLY